MQKHARKGREGWSETLAAYLYVTPENLTKFDNCEKTESPCIIGQDRSEPPRPRAEAAFITCINTKQTRPISLGFRASHQAQRRRSTKNGESDQQAACSARPPPPSLRRLFFFTLRKPLSFSSSSSPKFDSSLI